VMDHIFTANLNLITGIILYLFQLVLFNSQGNA
uniref:Uncharacterized protein n=1 Tax=Amphimedon queenslandica TaxID=400682 RepID=A0A1X7SPN0_AMPQE